MSHPGDRRPTLGRARVSCTAVMLLSLVACDDAPAARPPAPPEVRAPEAPPPSRGLQPGTRRLLASLPSDVEIVFVTTPGLPDWYSRWEEVVADYARSVRAAGVAVRVLASTPETRDSIAALGVPLEERSVGTASGELQTLQVQRGVVVRRGERRVLLAERAEYWWFEYELVRQLRAFAPPPYSVGIAPTRVPLSEALACLDRHDVREVDPTRPIDPGLRAVLLIEPDPLPAGAVAHLRAYLASGGSVGVFGGPARARGVPWEGGGVGFVEDSLAALLEEWGVSFETGAVVWTEGGGRVPVEVAPGFVHPIGYPLISGGSISEMAMHPAFLRGHSLRFPLASPMTLEEREGVHRSFVLAAEETWAAPPPRELEPRALREQLDAPDSRTEHPLAALLVRGGPRPARLLVSAADFVRDDLIEEAGCDNPLENADANPRIHFVRFVDWLALEPDLLDVGVSDRDVPTAF